MSIHKPACIRIVVVDDQIDIRVALVERLERHDDLQVIGTAADGLEAIHLIEQTQPDVALIDLKMPRLDGVGAIERIRRSDLRTRLLVLTTFGDRSSVQRALAAGATGFLLKGDPTDELACAIRACAAGKSVLHPNIHGVVVDSIVSLIGISGLGESPPRDLSARELEVLRQLGRGASNTEIGAALFISEGTVRNHLTAIYKKLGVGDRIQAALRARDIGIG